MVITSAVWLILLWLTIMVLILAGGLYKTARLIVDITRHMERETVTTSDLRIRVGMLEERMTAIDRWSMSSIVGTEKKDGQ